MNFWLMKSEPDDFSIDDLCAKPNQTETWHGIRNYQARNFIRDGMKIGDLAFFYHSSCKVPGIVGIVEVTSAPLTDQSAFDPNSIYFDAKSTPEQPKWFSINIRFVEKFTQIIPLSTLKSTPQLADMYLVTKGARLSIQPVSEAQWHIILALV